VLPSEEEEEERRTWDTKATCSTDASASSRT
jgi:hypothetical protein